MKTVRPDAQYAYYAFISYKRADSRWADWLYKNLQNYRLPGKLSRQHKDLSRRLCPVFMDKQDLAPGNLSENLKSNISMSKYFIAICSENVQNNPQYIDLELAYFLETHDNDYTKVIPFIVGSSDRPEIDCFSPAMQRLCQEHELVGVNISEKGKQRAFLKTVAYMHGLLVSEIESADDRRKRRNGAVASLAALLCVLACLFGVSYWWRHFAVHTEYYLGCTWQNNVAVGVGEIEEKVLSAYSRYYVLETVDGKVRSMEYRNSAGTVVPLDDEVKLLNEGASRVEFTYRDGDVLYMAKYYDYAGNPIICYEFSGDGTHVRLTHDDSSGHSAYASADGGQSSYDSSPVSNVSRYLQSFDEAGRLVERLFAYGDSYTQTADASGVFGYTISYDASGLMEKVTYLSKNGETRADSNGVAGILFEPDPTSGRMTAVTYLDKDGSPVIGKDGWATKRITWAANNNKGYVVHLGTDGEAMMIPGGYAAIENSFEGRVMSEQRFLDTEGNPVNNAWGYASSVMEADEKGRVISERYYDAAGEPAMELSVGAYGYQVHYTSDREYYRVLVDQMGEPMVGAAGYAYMYMVKDEYGQLLSAEYRDETNSPRTADYAFAVYTYHPDFYNAIIELSYLDADRRPVVVEGEGLGYATLVHEYDENGYSTMLKFLDEKGEPYESDRGYAMIVSSLEFDNGTTIETYYFYDENEMPVLHEATGSVGYRSYRGPNGKLSRVEYLDSKGNLMINDHSSYAAVEFTYDEDEGYTNSQRFFGISNIPIMPNGYFAVLEKRDTAQNAVEYQYYNTVGEPVVVPEYGYAAVYYGYDENDNLICEKYYGVENGKLVPMINQLYGYAAVRHEPDENGNLIGVRFYGAENGEFVPMVHPDYGYAGYNKEYDAAGNLLLEEYYGAEDGEFVPMLHPRYGYARNRKEYDAAGNPCLMEFYGVQNKEFVPMVHPYYGYARLVEEVNENGDLTLQEYYGVEEGRFVPMINELCGYAAVKQMYNEDGVLCRVEYYGAEGDDFVPMVYEPEGYAAAELVFDAQGNAVEIRYYTAENGEFVPMD